MEPEGSLNDNGATTVPQRCHNGTKSEKLSEPTRFTQAARLDIPIPILEFRFAGPCADSVQLNH